MPPGKRRLLSIPSSRIRGASIRCTAISGNGSRIANDTYEGAPVDGSPWLKGRCEQRVLRGGSWVSKADAVEAGSRYGVQSEGRVSNVGFRVARTLR
ncbi:SUMF1/EgtB/PvdO family nonheme iron enzyme [Bradyrhizobium sp. RT9a]|uniref:formylglycine-generating enzyme family protein n=1 Tax=Bradyrhizobium sp. RT9a TaxID=3156384 RepID=UPI003398208A